MRTICSRSSTSSRRDEAEVMLNTKRKPWPSLMYMSLCAMGCESVDVLPERGGGTGEAVVEEYGSGLHTSWPLVEH